MQLPTTNAPAEPAKGVSVDKLIAFGELSAPQIAEKVGVSLNFVRIRALQLGAPFSKRRTRAQILADLAQQLEQFEVRYHEQLRADRRNDPIT